MAFLKKFVTNIKNAFSEAAQDIKTDVAKKKESSTEKPEAQPIPTPSATTKPTEPIVTRSPASETIVKTPSTPTVNSQTINNPSSAISAEESEVVQHDLTTTGPMTLESLVYALELDINRLVIEPDVVTIPLDASGCDFETKEQLVQALVAEKHIPLFKPSEETIRNVSRKIFSSIRNNKEESFVSGFIFTSVNQDIDSEGFMVAEVTNIQTGQSVLFDIPAASSSSGDVSVDYELILMNLRVSCERLS